MSSSSASFCLRLEAKKKGQEIYLLALRFVVLVGVRAILIIAPVRKRDSGGLVQRHPIEPDRIFEHDLLGYGIRHPGEIFGDPLARLGPR